MTSPALNVYIDFVRKKKINYLYLSETAANVCDSLSLSLLMFENSFSSIIGCFIYFHNCHDTQSKFGAQWDCSHTSPIFCSDSTVNENMRIIQCTSQLTVTEQYLFSSTDVRLNHFTIKIINKWCQITANSIIKAAIIIALHYTPIYIYIYKINSWGFVIISNIS